VHSVWIRSLAHFSAPTEVVRCPVVVVFVERHIFYECWQFIFQKVGVYATCQLLCELVIPPAEGYWQG
jgi:hypothetical protein